MTTVTPFGVPTASIQVALTGAAEATVIGIPGPPGPPGPAGPPGPGAASYVFVQSTPSVTWVIDHGLDYTPQVTVVDSAGNQVEGDHNYGTPGQIILTFSAPFSGRAYLS